MSGSHPPPYRVDGRHLLLRNEVLTSGEPVYVDLFARFLNLTLPAEADIIITVRALIAATRDGGFPRYSTPPIRHPGSYRVDSNRLLWNGEELLAGNLFWLEIFRDILNATNPRSVDIAPALRILFGLAPDCSFGAGARLLADGSPLRLITGQKPTVRRRTG